MDYRSFYLHIWKTASAYMRACAAGKKKRYARHFMVSEEISLEQWEEASISRENTSSFLRLYYSIIVDLGGADEKVLY
jgi:hypothetical protein